MTIVLASWLSFFLCTCVCLCVLNKNNSLKWRSIEAKPVFRTPRPRALAIKLSSCRHVRAKSPFPGWRCLVFGRNGHRSYLTETKKKKKNWGHFFFMLQGHIYWNWIGNHWTARQPVSFTKQKKKNRNKRRQMHSRCSMGVFLLADDRCFPPNKIGPYWCNERV